jgi:hypothetical protein
VLLEDFSSFIPRIFDGARCVLRDYFGLLT